MRVVAGRFGSRRLVAPSGTSTRPTADRVREALFSMLGTVDGRDVLDLFAGSGALGIEALSRGASSAVFVDCDARAVVAVRANLEALGIDASVERCDAHAYLAAVARRPRPRFDLVLVDPPYRSGRSLAEPLAELLPAVLSDAARIVTESHKRDPLLLDLPLLRERTYGDTRIAIHGGP